MKINVLGTEYEVLHLTQEEYPKLADINASGLCEVYSKQIIYEKHADSPRNYANIEAFERKVLRHEIVHAFFAESGLRGECEFAENEELVDWIAAQLPKIYKACQDAGCEK